MTSYVNSRRAGCGAPTGADANRGAHDPATTWVTALRQVLAQLVAEGYLTRNVALLSIVSLATQNGLKPSPPSRYKSSSTAFPPTATGTPGTWPWLACDAERSPASAGPTSTSLTNSSTSGAHESMCAVTPSTRPIRKPSQRPGPYPSRMGCWQN